MGRLHQYPAHFGRDRRAQLVLGVECVRHLAFVRRRPAVTAIPRSDEAHTHPHAMAGLSHGEVDDILALLMQLNEYGVTIIMIEHIMRAVMSFSTRIAVLVAGQKIADGAPQEVMARADVRQAYTGVV